MEPNPSRATAAAHEDNLPDTPADAFVRAGVGCYRLADDSRVRWMDAGARHLFGLPAPPPEGAPAEPGGDGAAAPVIGQPIASLRGAPDLDERLRELLARHGRVQGLEWAVTARDGTRRWLLHDAWAVGPEVLVVVRDVTATRAAADERRHAEAEQRRAIVDSVPVGLHVWQLEPDGVLRLVEANAAADRILGIDHAPLRGRPIDEAFPGHRELSISDHYREVGRTGVPWQTRQVAYRDDAVEGAFEVHAFRSAPGRVVAAFLDVTDRIRSERALRESEERYRTIFESVDAAIFVHDLDSGEIVDHNGRARELFGFSDAELRNLGPDDASSGIPPYTAEDARRHMRAAVAGEPQRFEWQARRKDGSLFWVSVSLVRAHIGGRDRVLATVRDIDARRRAEDALRERERQLVTLFGNLPGMAYRCADDEQWTMSFVSEGCRALTGYTPEDLVDSRTIAYADLIHPDDRARVRAEVDRGLGQRHQFQCTYRIVTADGALKTVSERGVGVYEGDALVALEGFVEDVTDRSRAEARVRDLNARLEQRVRERTAQLEAANQELEAFTWSVSHDLRAPLRSIAGFSQALAEDYGDTLDPTAMDYLRRVLAATGRMQQLIDDLLALSRITRGPLERASVDLSALAAEVVKELRDGEPGRPVEVTIEPEVRADADPRLARVVLENLLGNAWKFSARRRPAHIRFGLLPPADRAVAGVPDAIEPGRAVYYVADDGAGFEMARADRLFGAFQRLHDASEFPGNGIGLAIVQRVVQRHGGRVWARGEVERGATFYFTL